MYADDVRSAGRRLAQLDEFMDVPGWVETFIAGFVGERNGVETIQAESDIARQRRIARDTMGSAA